MSRLSTSSLLPCLPDSLPSLSLSGVGPDPSLGRDGGGTWGKDTLGVRTQGEGPDLSGLTHRLARKQSRVDDG